MRVVWVLQHDDAETPALIQTVLERQGLQLPTLRPDRQPLPEKLAEDCSALVVMGGPMSVYDTERYPWIAQELTLIKEAVASARPVLAVCLGSQLLAAAGGADVFSGGLPKEIGWGKVKLTDAGRRDPLARFLANPTTDEPTTVFQWHGDTYNLPPGGTLLASSTRFPRQAFRLGRNAYGFQFHFEVTEQVIRQWVELWQDDVRAGETTADEIFAGLKEHLPLLNRRGEELVRTFAGLIHASPVRVLPATAGDETAVPAQRRSRIASMAEIDALAPPSPVEEGGTGAMKLDRLHGLRPHAETRDADPSGKPEQRDDENARMMRLDRLHGLRRRTGPQVADPAGKPEPPGRAAPVRRAKNPA